MNPTSASTATRHAARQARVEPVGKVILCYNDAIEMIF
jgi:hypothetical protein